jgi:hypothetical protein
MKIRSKYTCFVDNDVLFSEQWLEELISAAEANNAAVAHPVTLIGEFEDALIHHAGGRIIIDHTVSPPRFQDYHQLANQCFRDNKKALHIGPSDYAEFHCMLVRTEALRRIGYLDEALRSLSEHTDLCLEITRIGEKIYFAPSSVVTYAVPSHQSPLRVYDSKLFSSRWSAERNQQSVEWFYNKWGFFFDPEDPPTALQFGTNHARYVPELFSRSDHTATAFQIRKDSISNSDYPYAHTFPRLAQQCIDSGFSVEEISRVRDAHDLAASVHQGALRKCRLPFIDHCVAVGSILLDHGAPLDLICAGIAHAIYLKVTSAGPSGFLDGSPSSRSHVRDVLGFGVESIVYAYSHYLTPDSINSNLLGIEPEEFPLVLAAAAIVRVANELEECLDNKLIPDGKATAIGWRLEFVKQFKSLCTHCGYGSLALEAEQRLKSVSEYREDLTDMDNMALNEIIGSPLKDLRPPTYREGRMRRLKNNLKMLIPKRLRSSRLFHQINRKATSMLARVWQTRQ